MAKRRHETGKHENEEDINEDVFKPPEFDKEEYIHEELNRARAAIIPILFASVVGILTAYLYLNLDPAYAWPVSALIGLLSFVAVKFIYPLAGVDTSLLKKKDYLGHAVMYFFAWLAVFIIFLNPPFADYSAPEIQGVHIEAYSEGNWTDYSSADVANYSDYRIAAFVFDNTEVATVQISVNGGDWQQMHLNEDGTAYVFHFTDFDGHATYSIKAVDLYGHENTISGTLP